MKSDRLQGILFDDQPTKPVRSILTRTAALAERLRQVTGRSSLVESRPSAHNVTRIIVNKPASFAAADLAGRFRLRQD